MEECGTCPGCGTTAQSFSQRLIVDGCGHRKCRKCLLVDESCCSQCMVVNIHVAVAGCADREFIPGSLADSSFQRRHREDSGGGKRQLRYEEDSDCAEMRLKYEEYGSSGEVRWRYGEEGAGGEVERRYVEHSSGGEVRRRYEEDGSGGEVRRRYEEDGSGGEVWRWRVEDGDGDEVRRRYREYGVGDNIRQMCREDRAGSEDTLTPTLVSINSVISDKDMEIEEKHKLYSTNSKGFILISGGSPHRPTTHKRSSVIVQTSVIRCNSGHNRFNPRLEDASSRSSVNGTPIAAVDPQTLAPTSRGETGYVSSAPTPQTPRSETCDDELASVKVKRLYNWVDGQPTTSSRISRSEIPESLPPMVFRKPNPMVEKHAKETMERGKRVSRNFLSEIRNALDVKTSSDIQSIDENSFLCTKCSKVFKKGLLKRHQDCGGGKAELTCPFCRRVFKTSAHLVYHTRSQHTGERPYTCDICCKSFFQVVKLKRHALVHTGERPFACDICRKQFRTNYHLKEHRNIHTEETHHRCSQCSRSFADSNNYRRHMRVMHSEGRRHVCRLCSDRTVFKTKFDLRLHKHKEHRSPVHSVVCEICRKGFTSQRFLERHKLTHSKDDSERTVFISPELLPVPEEDPNLDPDDPLAFPEPEARPEAGSYQTYLQPSINQLDLVPSQEEQENQQRLVQQHQGLAKVLTDLSLQEKLILRKLFQEVLPEFQEEVVEDSLEEQTELDCYTSQADEEQIHPFHTKKRLLTRYRNQSDDGDNETLRSLTEATKLLLLNSGSVQINISPEQDPSFLNSLQKIIKDLRKSKGERRRESSDPV